jgi:Raf kinase inhibitor-like YbhB/YbcL family protein
MATEQRETLIISSTAFEHGAAIPVQYSCEGAGINPPLHIENIPQGTQSLAIIAEDPDTSKGVFDHWIAWNIPLLNDIAENSVPGISGINSSGKTGYHPPCPPNGSHRYFFYVFALDKELQLTAGAGKKDLQVAIKGHVLASGTLMGRYEKVKTGSAA